MLPSLTTVMRVIFPYEQPTLSTTMPACAKLTPVFLCLSEFCFDTELVGNIISELKRGKAPGLDGLSAEHLFYSNLLKCFFRILLVSSSNRCLHSNSDADQILQLLSLRSDSCLAVSKTCFEVLLY